jgi:hypothetical protein
MSGTEVTNAQYAEFLNAVAATDTHNLYNTSMGGDVLGGIARSGSSGGYTYTAKLGQESNPVNFVSWYDALRFANWRHNGKPSGAQGPATTENGAYTFSGGTTVGTRNAGALVFLPTENEWYKAAYYDATSASYFDYPTKSNAAPSSDSPPGGSNAANFYAGPFAHNPTDVGAYTGSPSPSGTYDQGGNVQEWVETASGTTRGARGGSWLSGASSLAASSASSLDPTTETNSVGFRIASPAPNPACSDGIDNDGDGLVDYPADPGCSKASSMKEAPACDDGIDNDGDGKIDWNGGPGGGTPDPQCVGKPYGGSEKPSGCGLGVELALLLPMLRVLRRRARTGLRAHGA